MGTGGGGRAGETLVGERGGSGAQYFFGDTGLDFDMTRVREPFLSHLVPSFQSGWEIS